MAKKLIDKSEVNALQREAQKLLSDAEKALAKAGKLAEKGRFSLTFMGHSYFPMSVYGSDYDSWEGMSNAERAQALGIISAKAAAKITPEQEQELEDRVETYIIDNDLYKDEYAQPGEFWAPSTC